MLRRVTLWTVGLAVIVFVVCVGFKYYAMSHRGWSGRGESGGKRVDEWQGNASPESSLLNLSRSEPKPFEGFPTGEPYLIKSPYVYGGPSINVKGLAAGAKVECPTTGKILTVPYVVWRLAVEAKLDEIVLPELRLIEKTLPEAIDYLRKQSVTLDPEGVGLAMTIDERIERISPGALAEESVTLDLADISLSEALRYVTGVSGVRWRLDPDGIVVVPSIERSLSTQPVDTRRYYVPPSAYEDFGRVDGESNQERRGAMEVLQSVGIPFADGTSATYNPSRSELSVTIGGNGHEFVAAWVEAMMMEEAGIERRVEAGSRFLEILEPASDE